MADTTEAVERLTYEEAEKLALRAIHDVDGRGMIGRGRDHLHQRVARAILTSEVKRTALLSERTALLERAERAERESAHLRLQAQSWACEAKTANATINEGYQAITGATGEPGNWNGAEPVKALIARAQAAETKLATLTEALRLWDASVVLRIENGKRSWKWSGARLQAAFEATRAALFQTQEEKTNG